MTDSQLQQQHQQHHFMALKSIYVSPTTPTQNCIGESEESEEFYEVSPVNIFTPLNHPMHFAKKMNQKTTCFGRFPVLVLSVDYHL